MSDLTFHVVIDQCGSAPNPPEEEVARVLSDAGYGGTVVRLDIPPTSSAKFEPGQCDAQHRPAKNKELRSVVLTSVADGNPLAPSRQDLAQALVITFTDGSTIRVEAKVEETPYMVIPCLKVES